MNQYTTTPFDTREYDLRGNLVKITLPGGGTRAMEYDYRDMMTKFTDESGKVTRYEYDAFLRRARKIEDAEGSAPVETRYLHKGWQVVEERDGENDTTATYVHGNYIDETIQMQRGGDSYYYFSDDLYSTVMLSDENAGIVETTMYSDYGEPRWFNAAGEPLLKSSVGNVRAFQGREWEGGSGYSFRFRRLDTPSGRFISPDPIGVWGDPINKGGQSGFLGDSPAVRLDPLGLQAGDCKVCGPSINRELVGAINQVWADWKTLEQDQRKKKCETGFPIINILDLEKTMRQLESAKSGFDLNPLNPVNRGKPEYWQKGGCTQGAQCVASVSVGGQCHDSAHVNYILYGVMRRLCEEAFPSYKDYAKLEIIISLYRRSIGYGDDVDGPIAWANYGYRWPTGGGLPPGLPSPSDRTRDCSQCTDGDGKPVTFSDLNPSTNFNYVWHDPLEPTPGLPTPEPPGWEPF